MTNEEINSLNELIAKCGIITYSSISFQSTNNNANYYLAVVDGETKYIFWEINDFIKYLLKIKKIAKEEATMIRLSI